MIKTVMVETKVVICDLCGDETGYSGDQGYAKQKKHFCKYHQKEETLWSSLAEYPKSQALFFEEAKDGPTEVVKEEEKIYSSGLHSSITHV